MPGKVEGFPKLEVCNFGSEALRPCPVGFVPGTEALRPCQERPKNSQNLENPAP